MEFYAIETPPPSLSTNKELRDESILLCNRTTDNQYSKFISNDELTSTIYNEMNTPLRSSLGNTKLKTRQDVRRFRKFLKRNHNFLSPSLMGVDPDTMCTYLLDYLTSIRTRKGSKYDPETLRSYYLSIQRYLKDSNYPYCLRNSPQFASCRDLIIQMRKEKNQTKFNAITSQIKSDTYQDLSINQIRASSSEDSRTNTCFELLPLSSLPPRKRQQMKYFLESNSSANTFLCRQIPRSMSSPTFTLSSDAYLILNQFMTYSPNRINYLEQLLDQSAACGIKQRLMLTILCNQWTGDIRIIHANLRHEISSFLPHILLINILSTKT